MKSKMGYSLFLNIVAWGAVWGIFESTVGYLLHSISFGYSWLIWYPFACLIMANVYRNTGNLASIFLVGLLCAAIKMLNLFLPGRIDKVINPAISIVFEALAMTAVVLVSNRLLKRKNTPKKALVALLMNTAWRSLFVLYLLLLVPDWMRDISVISSVEKFVPFFITQNLATSALIFIGYQFKNVILKPFEVTENCLSNRFCAMKNRAAPVLQVSLAALMLCVSIALQFLFK